jgi:hypothetical protein
VSRLFWCTKFRLCRPVVVEIMPWTASPSPLVFHPSEFCSPVFPLTDVMPCVQVRPERPIHESFWEHELQRPGSVTGMLNQLLTPTHPPYGTPSLVRSLSPHHSLRFHLAGPGHVHNPRSLLGPRLRTGQLCAPARHYRARGARVSWRTAGDDR